MPRILRWLSMCCIAASLCLVGCSDGGGDPSVAMGAQTGEVYLLVADAPDLEYDNVFLTIHEVSLLPSGKGGNSVVIFDSAKGVEVDLLTLYDEDFLLALCYDVPAGTYSKIRMRVSSIRAEGGPCEELKIKLPSGKIDVKPSAPFSVVPGGILSIRLDVSVPESIHLHVAGKSGKCIFRPVVFADVESGRPTRRCQRAIRGTIVDLVKRGESTVGFVMSLYRRACDLTVSLSPETVIFDAGGLPADPDALKLEQEVRVRGRLNAAGKLDALVVVIGDVQMVEGVAEGPVADGVFPFTAAPGQDVTGSLSVQVSDETFYLYGCNFRVGPEAVQKGMPTRLVGKRLTKGGVFRAVAVFMRPPILSGEITEFEWVGAGNQFTLRYEEDGGTKTRSLFLPLGSPVRLGRDGDVPLFVLRELLECEARGADVVLDRTDPKKAVAIHLRADSGEGEVVAVNPVARTLHEDGDVIQVMTGATLLDLRDGATRLPSLGDIPVGASVAYFGLEACPGGTVDFHAFTVLVLPE